MSLRITNAINDTLLPHRRKLLSHYAVVVETNVFLRVQVMTTAYYSVARAIGSNVGLYNIMRDYLPR